MLIGSNLLNYQIIQLVVYLSVLNPPREESFKRSNIILVAIK